MFKTSDSFKKIITHSKRKFHAGAHVDFPDGASIELTDRNIMADGGMEIDDAVSDTDSFEIGSAIIGELQMTLNNYEGEFNPYNFKGAAIKPWVGITTAVHWKDGEIIEKIPKGVFNVLSAPKKGSTIRLTAEDNLSKFDLPYSKSTLKYPATLGQIAADVCSVCGVALETTTFPNSTYSVTKRPPDSAVTCREVLSYAAQLAGCFARCDTGGAVEIRWYGTGDANYDIGNLPASLTISDNDTVITGIQIKGNDDSETVYSSGTDDFMLRISDNPLAQDNLQSLANTLGQQLINTSFRACEVTSLSNPAIEAGDIVCVTDKNGRTYKTFITKAEFSVGDNEVYYASAESKDENRSERFSKAEKAQVAANEAQKTADEANDGVAKAEIKIGDLEITIKGKVSFSDLKSSGTTEINGNNIVTGKIQSEDGDWWLDLETGKFYLKGGTFSGDVVFEGDDSIIYRNGCVYLQGLNIQIGGYEGAMGHANIQLKGNVEITDGLTIGDVNLNDAYSGDVGIRMSDDTKRTLRFKNGILVRNH